MSTATLPRSAALLVLIFLLVAATTTLAQFGSVIDSIVEDGIKSRAFPGASIIIGDHSGQLFYKNYGTFTYDAGSTPMSDTVRIF